MQTTEQQALMVAMIGDTPLGALATNVVGIATQYANVDAPFARLLLGGLSLERLYIERDLLKVKLAWAEGQITNATFRSSSNESDIAKAIRTRATALELQIADLEGKIRATTTIAVGLMTTNSPVRPPQPAPFPDADSAAYSGSPYIRPYKPQTS